MKAVDWEKVREENPIRYAKHMAQYRPALSISERMAKVGGGCRAMPGYVKHFHPLTSQRVGNDFMSVRFGPRLAALVNDLTPKDQEGLATVLKP